jgi:hypothetical protein
MNNQDEQEACRLLILITTKRVTFWCSRHYTHIHAAREQPAARDSILSFSKLKLRLSSSSEEMKNLVGEGGGGVLRKHFIQFQSHNICIDLG